MPSDQDRIKTSVAQFVRKFVGNHLVGARMDYLATYQCRAVAQNADGTLELLPDDSRLPSYSKVPIRYGVPGVSATVAGGARVLLEFASGNPQKPIASLWESASVTILTVTASAINLGGAGASQAFVLGTQYASHMATLQTQLGAASAAATPLLLPPAAAALKAALLAAQVAAGQLAADISTAIKGQ